MQGLRHGHESRSLRWDHRQSTFLVPWKMVLGWCRPLQVGSFVQWPNYWFRILACRFVFPWFRFVLFLRNMCRGKLDKKRQNFDLRVSFFRNRIKFIRVACFLDAICPFSFQVLSPPRTRRMCRTPRRQQPINHNSDFSTFHTNHNHVTILAHFTPTTTTLPNAKRLHEHH